MPSKVIPIMGPGSGNPELEKCPPSAHFELTFDELSQAIKDPDSISKLLGLAPGTIKNINVQIPETVMRVRAGSSATPAGNKRIYCCIKCQTDAVCCQEWLV
jgi:hypothetical protein